MFYHFCRDEGIEKKKTKLEKYVLLKKDTPERDYPSFAQQTIQTGSTRADKVIKLFARRRQIWEVARSSEIEDRRGTRRVGQQIGSTLDICQTRPKTTFRVHSHFSQFFAVQ